MLLSHLTGSLNSRQAALAFAEAGWLKELHHTLAWTAMPPWTKALPRSLRAQIGKRRFDSELAPYLYRHPLPEWGRLLAARLPLLPLSSIFSIRVSNNRFDRAVARRLRRRSCSFQSVYGYFDTSLHTFREAQKQGLCRIYELPTPYWRTVDRMVETESIRRPEWAATLPSRAALAACTFQRDEELRLADLVIVPSPFVRDSLQEAPTFKAQVIVVPYGCPEPTPAQPTRNKEPKPKNPEPLKLLFVGTLSQSKGLADLLDAILPLGDRVQLTLAGSAVVPGLPHLKAQTANLKSPVRFLGQLPHADLLAELPKHDLLVLPTLYEGLSLSLLEAMSQGLPVLSTTHCGLMGLIENNRHACLVPPAAPETLHAQILHLIEHPERRAEIAHAGCDWASKHSWTRYRQDLCMALKPRLTTKR